MISTIIYSFVLCENNNITWPNYRNSMSYFTKFMYNPLSRSLGFWIGCFVGFWTFDSVEDPKSNLFLNRREHKDFWTMAKRNKTTIVLILVNIVVVIGLFIVYDLHFRIGLDNAEPRLLQHIWVIFAGVTFVGTLFYIVVKVFELMP